MNIQQSPAVSPPRSEEEERLAGFVHRAPSPMLLVDRTLTIVDANLPAELILNSGPQNPRKLRGSFGKFVSIGLPALMKAVNRPEPEDIPVQLFSGRGVVRAEIRLGRAAPSERLRFVELRLDHRTEQLAKFQHMLDAMDRGNQGLLVSDSRDRIIALNTAASEILRLSQESALGRYLLPLVLSRGQGLEVPAVQGDLLDTGEWSGYLQDGRIRDRRTIHVRITQHCSVSDAGSTTKAAVRIAILSDATAQVDAEEELEQRAMRDELTSLLNRAGFMRTFEHRFEEARRLGDGLCLLYIDLDNFKQLNDQYGHKYGDQLLRAFAGRLSGSVKSSDVVARLGGDEFVILMDVYEDQEDLEPSITRLRQRLLAPYRLEDLDYVCTASFGSARYPNDAHDPDDLLICADQAMFKAKAEGKSTYRAFSPDIINSTRPGRSLVDDISRALEAHCFVPFYQPQFDLRSGRLHGAEVLVRWLDAETGKCRLPGEFLPAIADHPVLIRLGIRLLNLVFAQLESLFLNREPFTVSVNLSAMQLRSEAIVLHLEDLGERFPARAEHVAIEVTETSFFERDPVVLTNMERVSNAGYRMVLDDFGTGYASIFSLKAHDFALVKIDKAFLEPLGGSEEAGQALLESIIALLKGLGIPTLCEGIERKTQLDLLRQLGCEYGQGFLYAKPMSKSDFLRFLHGHRTPLSDSTDWGT